ncbi:MAG: alkyl sulfatase dimerization domain-containing protein [Pseudomonadota bacterium]|nr:alkyl sulfatase dimerization domain-containing protein [Pseudomonadota bacterium]
MRIRSLAAAAVLAASCAGPKDETAGAPASPPPAGVATDATRAANQAVAARLPLGDRADFDDARRGFVAAIEGGIIRDGDGEVVWDVARYAFLDAPAPSTVNPSLWRQSQLNAVHGLFEVTDGLWQVRGYDLAVMSVIRGEKGWIVVDPLLSRETAAAAMKLVNDNLGARPVSAVIFTHSHGDHFGGARALANEEDVAAGRVQIIAPEGFAENAVSENVLAGVAMARRAALQFGTDLPVGPAGQVDSGIGKALSSGVIGFLQPTRTIAKTGERLTLDDVEFVFVSAPESEAPSEFMFYLPQMKALCTAELATNTMHNVLTLRGAKVRDALAWSKYLGEAIEMFGAGTEVAFASHGWPRWGRDRVLAYLEDQRDLYRYINDQTLRLANNGETLHEIAAEIGEPAFMGEDFSVRGYYGTLNHNAKATYQRYFGWWDGNPANLDPHPPVEQAKRYVDLAGGADRMIAAAARAFADGDYRWSATLMNHLVFAAPGNKDARAWLAASYEQLGFQSESAIWRNYYLAAAQELRDGVRPRDGADLANPDFVRAIPTAEYFDALAVRLNPARAFDVKLNFVFTDTSERIGVSVRDGVATHRIGGYEGAPVTVTATRADFDEITLGRATFQGKLASGAIRVDGDPMTFGRFLLAHDRFDGNFNVAAP